jgi:high-affinity K+ transport system ATPase subunit B
MTTQSMGHKDTARDLRRQLYQRAIRDSFIKLDPRRMVRNPVMFVVEVGSVLTMALWLQALLGHGEAPTAFIGSVSLWLWFTVLFANFSEALAEGRGKAQAAALRRTRKETQAKKLRSPHHDRQYDSVPSTTLRQNDVFLVEAGDSVPADGEVIEGIASVDESALTGESAPVIRESAGDRSAVTGGTRVLSDWLVVSVTTNPGEGFLDRMIALVEGAKRQKTPNETPEGRSIVVLAKEKYGLRGRTVGASPEIPAGMRFTPFSAQTRMSGVDLDHTSIRKGAPDAIAALIQQRGKSVPPQMIQAVEKIARSGGTPLAVACNGEAIGVIHLKDVVKGGIKERFAQLRKMGIRTVMITGDNPLTAAASAAEAGVNDFLAQATPETKLKLIREYQTGGRLVAMTGDGTNDAPALAQADVAVAMNTGTQPAREAANMIDLDSKPTKLIDIVEIGKQLLMTRGALTTFSIANDVAKYFAIIPAAFASTY